MTSANDPKNLPESKSSVSKVPKYEQQDFLADLNHIKVMRPQIGKLSDNEMDDFTALLSVLDAKLAKLTDAEVAVNSELLQELRTEMMQVLVRLKELKQDLKSELVEMPKVQQAINLYNTNQAKAEVEVKPVTEPTEELEDA